MGIFNFFKTKDKSKEEANLTKVNLREFEEFIKEKEAKNEKRSKIFLSQVFDRLKQVILELEEEVIILNGNNISKNLAERKAEERVKIIVSENLKAYAYQLEKLIVKLQTLEENNPILLIKKIDGLFNDFSVKSNVNFQKATFLVGKEIEAVGESVSRFFRDLKSLVQENEELTKDYELIEFGELSISEMKKLEKLKEEVQNKVKSFIYEEKSLKSLVDKNIIELENYKKTKEYKEFVELKLKAKNLDDEIKKEIAYLRSSIDFKALEKIFHTNEKKMTILKKYNQDFYDSFKLDNCNVIIDLMKEAKIEFKLETNIENLKEIIKTIKMKLSELSEINLLILAFEDKTLIFEKDMEKAKNEIIFLKKEQERENKILEETDKNITEKVNSLKEKLKKFNLEFNY